MKLHHRRPQTLGGFKKSFQEQNETHEKALTTNNSTLFGKTCKMTPPATKGNRKRDKPGIKGRQDSRTQTRQPTQAQMVGAQMVGKKRNLLMNTTHKRDK